MATALLAVGGLSATPAAVAAPTAATSQAFVTNFGPAGYVKATNEVYGITRENGDSSAWQSVAINASTHAVRPLTRGTAAGATYGGSSCNNHRGVIDVSSDGKYMLVEVEDPTVSCTPDGFRQPGKGADNDIYLATTDGKKAWLIYDSADGQDNWPGTMWARFDSGTSTRIVFSNMHFRAGLAEVLGQWQPTVGAITWSGGAVGSGTPKLTVTKTLGDPARFNETYGFTHDHSAIVFASDRDTPNHPLKSRIYTAKVATGAINQISPHAFDNDYCEFAGYSPNGDKLIIGTSHNGYGGGMDYWEVPATGSANATPTRLTHFSDAATGNSVYGVVGGWAFRDNTSFFGSHSTTAEANSIDSVLVGGA